MTFAIKKLKHEDTKKGDWVGQEVVNLLGLISRFKRREYLIPKISIFLVTQNIMRHLLASLMP